MPKTKVTTKKVKGSKTDKEKCLAKGGNWRWTGSACVNSGPKTKGKLLEDLKIKNIKF